MKGPGEETSREPEPGGSSLVWGYSKPFSSVFYERRLNVLLFPLLEGFHLDFIPVVWDRSDASKRKTSFGLLYACLIVLPPSDDAGTTRMVCPSSRQRWVPMSPSRCWWAHLPFELHPPDSQHLKASGSLARRA